MASQSILCWANMNMNMNMNNDTYKYTDLSIIAFIATFPILSLAVKGEADAVAVAIYFMLYFLIAGYFVRKTLIEKSEIISRNEKTIERLESMLSRSGVSLDW